jgi:hypothetical protein
LTWASQFQTKAHFNKECHPNFRKMSKENGDPTETRSSTVSPRGDPFMAKVRIVRERQADAVHPNDVRGLGDPELFQKSGMVAHLVIQPAPEAKTIGDLCEAYSLVISPASKVASVSHLGVQSPRLGNHCADALKLFMTAVEVCRKNPSSHCTVFLTSGLRSLLRERIRLEKDGQHKEVEAILKNSAKLSAPLIVHGLAAHAIHQAGLGDLPGESGWTELTSSQLLAIHEKLTNDAKGHQSEISPKARAAS